MIPFKKISALIPIKSAITEGKNLDEGYPTWLATVPVKTAALMVMAAMAPITAVAGTAAGVAVSTVVVAGVAVVSAEAADRQQDFSDSLLSTDGDGCLCF